MEIAYKEQNFDFPRDLWKIFVLYHTFWFLKVGQISKHSELLKTKSKVCILIVTDAMHHVVGPGSDGEGIKSYNFNSL